METDRRLPYLKMKTAQESLHTLEIVPVKMESWNKNGIIFKYQAVMSLTPSTNML